MGLLDELQLDTNLPPVWSRDGSATYDLPPGLSPHTDPDTKLRPHVRQDVLHYFNDQRVEGDLFKRDLVLQQQVNILASNLGGLTFSIPVTRLAPGKHISLPILTGQIGGVDVFTAINLKYMGCTTPGTTSTSYRMQLVDLSSNTVIYEVNSTAKIAAYTNVTLNSSHDYEMRVINLKTGSTVTPTTDPNCGDVGGFVILSPQI